MIRRLLIANRGEIACRIIRTARRMGIETAVVYSHVDRDLPHVVQADHAVCIGAAPAAESYLNVDAIIDAAQITHVDAIHPGYGFLSENTTLVEKCDERGIVFVGPTIDAIRSMGSKSLAKQIMQNAGIPLLPGYHDDQQDLTALRSAAEDCGYPVLIKASAGGGGKGMRVVHTAEEFELQLQAARREATGAFGDDRVIIEKFLLSPRHIEVQIFADAHGNIVHLYDRDCSIQRRYQKIVEEAPAPQLEDNQRNALYTAAINAARAINYLGAGTVEFICDAQDCFFMEMNTRLQVEHPVTEMITGVDLVEWQLRVAAGERLPLLQDDIHVRGHAIEARIYAEDTEDEFLPSTGTITRLDFPFTDTDTRIDSGYQSGNTVSVHYDPMIAKLICHGETRKHATKKITEGLTETIFLGLKNNVDYLIRTVNHKNFLAADYDTGFITAHHDDLLQRKNDSDIQLIAIAAAYRFSGMDESKAITANPWQLGDNWRMNSLAKKNYVLCVEKVHYAVDVSAVDDTYTVKIGSHVRILSKTQIEPGHLRCLVDHANVSATLIRQGNIVAVFANIGQAVIEMVDFTQSSANNAEWDSRVTSPMPGTVKVVFVADGDSVRKGDPLMVIEAMKMEHSIVAPRDGAVSAVLCKVGETISEGAGLIDIDKNEK